MRALAPVAGAPQQPGQSHDRRRQLEQNHRFGSSSRPAAQCAFKGTRSTPAEFDAAQCMPRTASTSVLPVIDQPAPVKDADRIQLKVGALGHRELFGAQLVAAMIDRINAGQATRPLTRTEQKPRRLPLRTALKSRTFRSRRLFAAD